MTPPDEELTDPLAFNFLIYEKPESPPIITVNCAMEDDTPLEDGVVDPANHCLWVDNWRSYKIRLPVRGFQVLINKQDFPSGVTLLPDKKQAMVTAQLIEASRIYLEAKMRCYVAAVMANPRALDVSIAMPKTPLIGIEDRGKKIQVVGRSDILLVVSRVPENKVAYLKDDDGIAIS